MKEKRIHHYIIIANSEHLKEPLAVHYAFEDKMTLNDFKTIKTDLKTIREYDSNNCIAARYLITTSRSWETVVKSDPWFTNKKLITTNEMIEVIKKENNFL